jgi:CheY-like chemotaxis protein
VTDETTASILVVEDDEPTQKLLQAVLRRCGYSSVVAGNGAEAIELLRINDYAAVVLDIMMPAVGGKDVLDFLAAAGKVVPVIVCSAAGPAALRDFDPRIVRAVVRKPFDVDQFVETVMRVAGR